MRREGVEAEALLRFIAHTVMIPQSIDESGNRAI
jgi:hypothetical protein